MHYCNENRQNHPTQKPEGLIERMVLASSDEGDVVLDLFSGSGTTLRVCQHLNRNCIGIELNPKYVEMIEERLNSEFIGFDSIDPRMERVPLDLNTKKIRKKYLENHKKMVFSIANHLMTSSRNPFRNCTARHKTRKEKYKRNWNLIDKRQGEIDWMTDHYSSPSNPSTGFREGDSDY